LKEIRGKAVVIKGGWLKRVSTTTETLIRNAIEWNFKKEKRLAKVYCWQKWFLLKRSFSRTKGRKFGDKMSNIYEKRGDMKEDE